MAACPSCNRSLKLPDEALGRKFKCPCGTKLRAMRGTDGGTVLEPVEPATSAPAATPRHARREAPQRIWDRSARYRLQRGGPPVPTIVAAVLLFLVGGGCLFLMGMVMLLPAEFNDFLPGIQTFAILAFAIPGLVFVLCGFGCLGGSNFGRISAVVFCGLLLISLFGSGVTRGALLSMAIHAAIIACLFMPTSNDFFAGRPPADAPSRRRNRR